MAGAEEKLEWLVAALRTPTDECIDWPFTTVRDGRANWSGSGNWPQYVSHISLILDGRPRPKDGRNALQSCDRPICINPRHLRWGTQLENTRESMSRGRRPSVANRLTKEQAVEIRRRYAEGRVTQQSLGEEFGVSKMTISHVVNHKTWSDV